jgi:hypothetical protein
MPSECGRRITAHVLTLYFQNMPRKDSNIMMKIVAKATMDSFDQAGGVFELDWTDVAGTVSMCDCARLTYNRYR